MKIFKENTIALMKAEEYLPMLDNESIDLTVTSPPYDEVRTYESEEIEFDLDIIIPELYRVTKKGGIVVWIVGDQTINGSETGTSFKHALKFMSYGWFLHDTMIYKKSNPIPNAGIRYQQCFEYMFVFSKGAPKTTNIQKKLSYNALNDKREFRYKSTNRKPNGEPRETKIFRKSVYVAKENIFEYTVGGGSVTKDKIAHKHPAIFPEKLVRDHISSWSNEGDSVLDIFSGSATTAKVAAVMKRKFYGCEKLPKYHKLGNIRINEYINQLF